MRKAWIAIMVVALTAAFAGTAMADLAVNGFVGVKPFVSNMKNYGLGYTAPTAGKTDTGLNVTNTAAYIEERARLKFTLGDENVKGVFFFEYDMAWGDSAYSTGRNIGGGLESDTINQETKNIYLWFKVPNTSLDFTVGLQNQSDSYAGVILGYADLAGVFANFKYEPLGFRFGYAKFWEGAVRKADDVDFWLAEAKFLPTKNARLGFNLYFMNAMGPNGNTGGANFPGVVAGNQVFGERGAVAAWTPNEFTIPTLRKVQVWIPGIDGSFNLGPATLSGFFFYELGKAKAVVGTDVDVSGFALDLRGDVNAGPGKLFIEGLYVSGDDNRTDTKYKGILTGGNFNLAGSFYSRTDMFILFPNITDYNTSQPLAYDPGNGGAGVLHFAAGFTMPLTDKLKGKLGIGYLEAAKKRQRDVANVNFQNKKDMATEVNGVLTFNIQKGLDLDLVGAYAFLGKAYEPATGLINPDDLYDLHARLVYAF